MASGALDSVTDDDELRGLLTDREREILSNKADVDESYYYRVVSKVRKKIQRIARDKEILYKHHDKLNRELNEAVCDPEEKQENNE